jgi:hypothetical protein
MTSETFFNSQVLSNLAISIFYYPFYRNFAELRLTYLKEGFYNYMIREAKISIKRNGFYRGGLSYYFFNILLSFVDRINAMRGSKDKIIKAPLVMFPVYIFNYPFLMNSLKRAMNFPDYTPLSNPQQVFRMLFSKKNYKGFISYNLICFLTFLPFINLISHKFETARLASIFGHNFGMKLTFWDAYNYFKTNDFNKAGKFSYNFPLHIYNTILLIAFVYSAKKEYDKNK